MDLKKFEFNCLNHFLPGLTDFKPGIVVEAHASTSPSIPCSHHACVPTRPGRSHHTPPPESASYLPPSTPPCGAPKPDPPPTASCRHDRFKKCRASSLTPFSPRQFSSNEACADHNAPFLDLSSALAHRSSADPARFGRNRNAAAIAALR
jgi:hypothetical protein